MGWDNPGALLLAGLGLMLVWAGIEDVRRREIANWKNAAIALAAPLWWWSAGVSLWPGVALQLGVAGIVFAMFCAAFARGWMGGGDVKLIGAVALWLPIVPLVAMLTAMALLGGVLTIVMLIDQRLFRRPATPEIPYGVAIAAATLLVLRQPLLNQFG